MAILNDPLLEQPPLDAKIWRYMDFSKLVRLLSTSSVFFARADTFDDSWEGSISPNDVSARAAAIARIEESEEKQQRLIDDCRNAFEGFRRHTYISCWHENPGESDAMWKLYLKSGEGIALQTSFGRLKGELGKAQRLIHLGRIKYADYKKTSIPGATPRLIGPHLTIGPFGPFTHKRLGFSHEQEVRAIFQDSYTFIDDPPEKERGVEIEVNIEELVEDVYVAPRTPGWFRDAVQSALEKFGINKKVHPSEFDDGPIR
jgi:hypothetical protein